MSKKRHFFPVGSCFEWHNLIFRVEKSKRCTGCWFYTNVEENCISSHFSGIPSCSGLLRQDGEDVRFVLIGKVDK